jgi:hypothetical protein
MKIRNNIFHSMVEWYSEVRNFDPSAPLNFTTAKARMEADSNVRMKSCMQVVYWIENGVWFSNICNDQMDVNLMPAEINGTWQEVTDV